MTYHYERFISWKLHTTLCGDETYPCCAIFPVREDWNLHHTSHIRQSQCLSPPCRGPTVSSTLSAFPRWSPESSPLSLVESQQCFTLIGWILIILLLLLCHKEPAQDTQSPLLGAFLAFHWFFHAQKWSIKVTTSSQTSIFDGEDWWSHNTVRYSAQQNISIES